MRFSTLFRMTLATVVASLIATLAFAQSEGEAQQDKVSEREKERVLTAMERVITRMAYVPGVDFGEWPTMIEEYREQIDEATTRGEFVTEVNRALQNFGFSHIVLFSPQSAQRRFQQEMVGIGVRIQQEENGIRVVRVFEDGAAAKEGVRVGDLLFEADGKPIRGPLDLAGEEGEPVTVKINRDGEILEKTLVRKKFSLIIPEELKWVEDNVAHLIVPSFDVSYDRKRLQGFIAEANDAEMIILDLRGNGGGRVANLLHLASFFLHREEPLGTFIDRTMEAKYLEDTGEEAKDIFAIAEWSTQKVRPLKRNIEPFDGEIVVLVDGASASASEMMAAALRDHRGAQIIGSRTAGAVLASMMQRLVNGYLLQFPLTDYVTLSGLRIEGNGLEPSIAAPPHRFGEPDNGVEQALKWFNNRRVAA
ncbi:MAG: PDZ domain-containing protein [Armatimonadetes bacterium]|nr:PDZ domain-containing protein [Armatimonadota bacterium]